MAMRRSEVVIRKVPLQPYEAHWMCDRDGCEGEMRDNSGIVLTSYPPQYPHHCDHCGRYDTADSHYPCVMHEPDRGHHAPQL